MRKTYSITHSQSEIETVGAWINQPNSPASAYLDNHESFLAIIGEDGLTNRERIERKYKFPEDVNRKGARSNKLPLKPGTVLFIEAEKINTQIFLTEGIEIVSTDEAAFKAFQLAALEADPGYVQISAPITSQSYQGVSKSIFPELTVWMWCRSLSSPDQMDGELKGEFFDLTPFIQRISTNMSKTGGNFQITLPPLECVLNDQNNWTLKKSSITQYQTDTGATISGLGYVANSNLYSLKQGENDLGDEYGRTQFMFHNLINTNDLVFIRFETLELEKEQRFEDAKEFYINKRTLPGGSMT